MCVREDEKYEAYERNYRSYICGHLRGDYDLFELGRTSSSEAGTRAGSGHKAMRPLSFLRSLPLVAPSGASLVLHSFGIDRSPGQACRSITQSGDRAMQRVVTGVGHDPRPVP